MQSAVTESHPALRKYSFQQNLQELTHNHREVLFFASGNLPDIWQYTNVELNYQ